MIRFQQCLQHFLRTVLVFHVYNWICFHKSDGPFFVLVATYFMYCVIFIAFLVLDILHIWICFQNTDHPFFDWFLCFLRKNCLCTTLFSKQNGSSISCFHFFFKYENWLSIFFSCLWRLVFLLLRISLTFIFISVFDLFISGFYSLCHLVVHFFICALHVMMHQLNKGTTRWHRQWKLETNRLNTLINMKVRGNSQDVKKSLLSFLFWLQLISCNVWIFLFFLFFLRKNCLCTNLF